MRLCADPPSPCECRCATPSPRSSPVRLPDSGRRWCDRQAGALTGTWPLLTRTRTEEATRAVPGVPAQPAPGSRLGTAGRTQPRDQSSGGSWLPTVAAQVPLWLGAHCTWPCRARRAGSSRPVTLAWARLTRGHHPPGPGCLGLSHCTPRLRAPAGSCRMVGPCLGPTPLPRPAASRAPVLPEQSSGVLRAWPGGHRGVRTPDLRTGLCSQRAF